MPDEPPEPAPEDEPSGPHQMRLALIAILPELAPLYEFAEGQRAELERRGWSPTAAESAASVILTALLSKALYN